MFSIRRAPSNSVVTSDKCSRITNRCTPSVTIWKACAECCSREAFFQKSAICYHCSAITWPNFVWSFREKLASRELRGSLWAVLVKPCYITASWHVRFAGTEAKQSNNPLAATQNGINIHSKLLHPPSYRQQIRIERSLQKRSRCIEKNWPFEWEYESKWSSVEKGSVCSGQSSLLPLIWLFELKLKQMAVEERALLMWQLVASRCVLQLCLLKDILSRAVVDLIEENRLGTSVSFPIVTFPIFRKPFSHLIFPPRMTSEWLIWHKIMTSSNEGVCCLTFLKLMRQNGNKNSDPDIWIRVFHFLLNLLFYWVQ